MSGRLILHGATDPRENMAIDQALLLSCEGGNGGFPVLRFYWWTVPTLSLGAKEDVKKAADTEACRHNNIAIVRRITGGRAVLHHRELTYSITGPIGTPPYIGSILDSYQRIAGAMRKGFADLGAELDFTPGSRHSGGAHLPCFAAPGRFELAYQGRKVVGSAQRRLKRSALQHGSILQYSDVDLLATATGAENGGGSLAAVMIGFSEILV